MPAALTEDLLEEVLLRIPPDYPGSLLRAALVSKRWCRLICARGFRRRFRLFHGRPPLLGLVCQRDRRAFNRLFIPESSFCPRDRADRRDMNAVHSCHGRVLLRSVYWISRKMAQDLFVWDPITDKLRKLPRWPLYSHRLCSQCNAAVLCAVLGDGCDHLDCQHGPFSVVLVGNDTHAQTFISVYSSDTDRWSEPMHAGQHYEDMEKGNSVVIGTVVYFTVSTHEEPTILKYDLLTQEISPIHVPRVGVLEQIIKPEDIVLMPMEDGRLGFAGMRNDSTLSLWSRKEHGPDEGARWAQSRVIDLCTLYHDKDYLKWTYVVAFADTRRGRVIFIRSRSDRLISLLLKSSRRSQVIRDSLCMGRVVPYVSFCTPALGAVSMDADQE